MQKAMLTMLGATDDCIESMVQEARNISYYTPYARYLNDENHTEVLIDTIHDDVSITVPMIKRPGISLDAVVVVNENDEAENYLLFKSDDKNGYELIHNSVTGDRTVADAMPFPPEFIEDRYKSIFQLIAEFPYETGNYLRIDVTDEPEPGSGKTRSEMVVEMDVANAFIMTKIPENEKIVKKVSKLRYKQGRNNRKRYIQGGREITVVRKPHDAHVEVSLQLIDKMGIGIYLTQIFKDYGETELALKIRAHQDDAMEDMFQEAQDNTEFNTPVSLEHILGVFTKLIPDWAQDLATAKISQGPMLHQKKKRSILTLVLDVAA